MSQVVKGTFTATGSVNLLGQVSDALVIPTPSNAPAVKARVNQGLMDVVTMSELWRQMLAVRASN